MDHNSTFLGIKGNCGHKEARVALLYGYEERARLRYQTELKRNILPANFPPLGFALRADRLFIFLLILKSFYSNGRKLAHQITRIHPKIRKLREAIPFPQVLAKVTLLSPSRWIVLTNNLLLTFKERRVYQSPTEVILLKDIISIKTSEE